MGAVASLPILNPGERSRFRRKLLHWFRVYKRDLPWRANNDPYAVWVSEIMLQQTRVAAVAERYVQFMRRFPNVQALASAPLDDVLALWSGLGYYRRARMLHQAARQIVEEQNGVMPTSAEQWRTLPGIGLYTAAAIASIAFNEAIAVVDGNVERVVARVRGADLSDAEVWIAADELLSRHSPGDFNQAMMELGATVCTPKSPVCLMCQVHDFCATRGEHMTTAPPPRIKREVAYALMRRRDKVALVQRDANERLMAGMWELPPAHVNGDAPLMTLKHAITTTDYAVRIFTSLSTSDPKVRWFTPEQLPELPLTVLARKVLRKAGLIS